MPISVAEGYLLGMFSTLHHMIDAPQEEILAEVPVADEIKEALLNRTGRCGTLYNLILSYEAADWDAINRYAAELGIPVKLIDGTRSYKEQDKLFRKRPKVTNARGGQSWHNFGLAFDFGLFRGKEYLGESPHYKTLGAIASTMPGLTWGGTWVNLVDEPHIQLNLFDTVAKARAAFEA
jgi:hypothetical protein